MIKIGLIGEDDTDTGAITNLLKQKYGTGFGYRTLSIHKKGSQIFTTAAQRSYNFEIKKDPPHCIIVIADADALSTESAKINKIKDLYERLAKELNCQSVLLLNIFELEALIFADIEVFNRIYNTTIPGNRNVTFIHSPKEELQHKTGRNKKYAEAHCPDIFKELRIDTISKNCAYFRDFLGQLSKIVAEKQQVL